MLKANTTRINEMVDVLVEQKRLESTLDAKQYALVSLNHILLTKTDF